MNFKNTHQQEHDFLISLGYEEKQYGYVRKNQNETMQIVTPFGSDYEFQVWATYQDEDNNEKIYNTGIVKFAGFPQLQTVVLLFEQIKDNHLL